MSPSFRSIIHGNGVLYGLKSISFGGSQREPHLREESRARAGKAAGCCLRRCTVALMKLIEIVSFFVLKIVLLVTFQCDFFLKRPTAAQRVTNSAAPQKPLLQSKLSATC